MDQHLTNLETGEFLVTLMYCLPQVSSPELDNLFEKLQNYRSENVFWILGGEINLN